MITLESNIHSPTTVSLESGKQSDKRTSFAEIGSGRSSLPPSTRFSFFRLCLPSANPFGSASRQTGILNARDTGATEHAVGDTESNHHAYRLYKRRFIGLAASVLLNVGSGMSYAWFGPIANNVIVDFPGITLAGVNWLGNIAFLVGLIMAPIAATLAKRFGLRTCFLSASCILLFGSWIRYAATANSISSNGAYALLFFGQFFSAIAQTIFQILGPAFSETWFNLTGRTTATMIISIAAPVGGAIGQILSPITGTTRHSILVLAIIGTGVAPLSLLVGRAPPTPPSYSGSQPSPPFLQTCKAILGLTPKPPPITDPFSPIEPEGTMDGQASRADSDRYSEQQVTAGYMTRHERIDFAVVFIVFSQLSGIINAFSILSSQILEPYGYSDDTAGFMGAALLISGIVAAIITSPLFDRVLTHHLSLAARIFTPIVSLTWFTMIWAVAPKNAQAIYALLVLIGIFSISLLPIGLELGVELTRDAATSSAILWSGSNIFSIIFVEVNSALAYGPNGSPPNNLHRALVFQGVFVLISTCCVFVLRGKQARRELDVNALNGNIPESAVPLESLHED